MLRNFNRLRYLCRCEFIRTQVVDYANKFAPTARATAISRFINSDGQSDAHGVSSAVIDAASGCGQRAPLRRELAQIFEYRQSRCAFQRRVTAAGLPCEIGAGLNQALKHFQFAG